MSTKNYIHHLIKMFEVIKKKRKKKEVIVINKVFTKLYSIVIADFKKSKILTFSLITATFKF